LRRVFNMQSKKIIASFELTLMIVGMFAFSYGVAMTDGAFEEMDKKYDEARAERLTSLENIQPRKSAIGVIFDYLRKPMIPVVSAFDDANDDGIDDNTQGIGQEGLSAGDRLLGRYFIEKETRSSFTISSQAAGSGCCLVTENGQTCATVEPSNCVDKSPFAEGSLCAQTSFCKKGCCYDESAGIYDRNTLEVDCSREWVDDSNCNMPAARLGCCVLESETFFETYQQCDVRVRAFAQGDGVVDWRGDLNEGQCVVLSATQKEGACVIGAGECKFGTEATCYSYDGEFNEGFLCTSPLLETNCEPTDQTTCVDGRDGVYFLDSCGNIANIYDFDRSDDPVYWDLVAVPEDVCGADDDDANANSAGCGNCNRFLGSICGSSKKDGFEVDIGDNYCKDTSCMFDGEAYENGESWCVYDGSIGNGTDVVGSRHWKYVCSQGVTQVEPCADYRNQICVQTNTFDVNGTDVEFRNSACVANNWRKCIDLNGDEDGMEVCADTLNCRIEKVDIADKFNFDVCLPKYPGGFSLKDTRYMKTAESLCSMADQTCTVVYKPKTWGGCELVANGACLGEGFAQGMNEFCTGLGDCGGAVNIEGEYSDNYEVGGSSKLSQGWINDLKDLANPVDGQFAEVEDYTEFLEAAGLWGRPNNEGEAGEGEEVEDSGVQDIAKGVAGIGFAMGAAALLAAGSGLAGAATLTGLGALAGTTGVAAGATVGTGSAAIAAGGAPAVGASFAGAAIAFGIGMVAGSMIAQRLGLSAGGSLLMALGVGFLALSFFITGAWNPVLFWVGVALIVISFFFGGDDCDPVEVTFECKPWKAPPGADDCEKCNDDPLKPCSEYRCNSLGAACELANKGTENELCHSGEDNGRVPILNPMIDVIFNGGVYDDITDGGFGITNVYGGCIDAYTTVEFGITTDELAYCKFDMEPREFNEMSYDLGANAYLYDHNTMFVLPDPSHGQSQGGNWTGDLSLYIKCQDAFGHETPSFYTVEMCVVEGDDITGPLIRATEPANNAMVSFDKTSKNVTIVTNEFATCKWDVSDVEYSLMENPMICNDTFGKPSVPQGYVCTDVLPIGDGDNTHYIRCADQPWLNEISERNANRDSFVYTLRKPSEKISIEKIAPAMDFEVNTAMTTIELKVQTANGGDYHWCSYSFSGYDNMIEFFETGEDDVHVQLLNRPAGHNKIYVECRDETGDAVQGLTEFNIVRDVSTPQIARAWQEYGELYIVTTESAECRYATTSCGFAWDDGITIGIGEEHTISSVKGQNYFIKCEDEFGNAPAGCSITLRAL